MTNYSFGLLGSSESIWVALRPRPQGHGVVVQLRWSAL